MSRPARAKGLRLFVAVYPPAETARALQAAVGALELPPHRPVPIEQVHMTLHFIGDTRQADLERTTETVRCCASGLDCFELLPRRLITLPQRGRPRLVAAEADCPPALLELQHRLASRLARKPRRRAGDRFRPHFTLCRFRTPAAMGAVDEPIDADPFAVREVGLMRSVLSPQGAQHHQVASFPLASGKRS